MQPVQDPGWGQAARGMLWVLLPGVALRRARRQMDEGADRLLLLRKLYLSFVSAAVLLGVVVYVLDRSSGLGGNGVPAGAALAVVLAADIAAVLGARFGKPLSCEADEALANSYTTRLFLRIAFVETAALVGFVAFVVTGAPALYVLGLAGSLVGFALAAPSAGRLAAEQEALHRAGCNRSLVAALRAREAGPPG